MPKKKVVEFECDRCGKTWLVPADKQDGDTARAVVSFINAQGDEEVAAQYEVLCDSCASAVRNYLGSVVREKKPEDEKSKAKENPTTVVEELSEEDLTSQQELL